MSIQSPCAFVAAYVNYLTCELYLNAEGNIVAHIPTKATCEATLEIGTNNFITVEVVCRAMGIEPTWN